MAAKGKKGTLPNREEELKGQLARALADYDNLRKRTEAERGEIIKLALFGFFEKLAPIIDNLKKAQGHLKDEGLGHILSDLERVFIEEGIESIEAEGGAFDENLHDAVELEPTGDESKEGKVSEVLQMGYRFKDGPVIRPAKVKVFKVNK